MFEVTKSYGHDRGLTTTFRNWRDNGHCSQLHGYALRFDFVFRGLPDGRGWLVDFGALAALHDWLKENHDHVAYVAQDDPKRPLIEMIEREGLLNLRVVPLVSLEAFAERAFHKAAEWVEHYNFHDPFRSAMFGPDQKVQLHRCTVWEHPANAATYYAD